MKKKWLQLGLLAAVVAAICMPVQFAAAQASEDNTWASMIRGYVCPVTVKR